MDDSMGKIRLLDQAEGLYLVSGRLVQLVDNAIDVSVPENQDNVVYYAEHMGDGKRGMPYGPFTVLRIFPKSKTNFGFLHSKELISPKWFPPHIRTILKKELPEHANEF